MQNSSTPVMLIARLTVIRCFPYHVWKYATLSAMLLRSCCSTASEACQLYARRFQPSSTSGSHVVAGIGWPKVGVSHGPHSPLASGLARLHSGRRLPFASLQERSVITAIRLAGALLDEMPLLSVSLYLPSEPLMAVRPFPNRS